MIDIMAANGDQNPPRLQRVFWAMVEGAAATALLIAGGKEALSAVQVNFLALILSLDMWLHLNSQSAFSFQNIWKHFRPALKFV